MAHPWLHHGKVNAVVAVVKKISENIAVVREVNMAISMKNRCSVLLIMKAFLRSSIVNFKPSLIIP